MAAGKKTGGRQKGTPNRASVELAAAIAASGLTPLDYMLNTLRDESADPRRRDWAAANAAPYIHPKLAQVEVGNKPGERFLISLQSTDADL